MKAKAFAPFVFLVALNAFFLKLLQRFGIIGVRVELIEVFVLVSKPFKKLSV